MSESGENTSQVEGKVPEESSILGMYGRKEMFKTQQEAGFTEVTFGSGPWKDGKRIVAEFAFTGARQQKRRLFKTPQEIVHTIEFHKIVDDVSGNTLRSQPTEHDYSEEDYKKHLLEFGINPSQNQNLAELLENWKEEPSK